MAIPLPTRARDGGIRTHYFVDVPAGRRAEVEARAAALRDLLGSVRYCVRFPGAINAALLG